MEIKRGCLYEGYGVVVMAVEQVDERQFSGIVIVGQDNFVKGFFCSTWQISVFTEVKENKTEYTKEEIEEEVETRVRFKMNELLTGLRNRSAYNWHSAFNTGNPKYQHFMEAQNEMVEMFQKELEMKFPYKFNEMKQKEQSKRVDKVMDDIINRFRLRGRTTPYERTTLLYNLLKPLLK